LIVIDASSKASSVGDTSEASETSSPPPLLPEDHRLSPLPLPLPSNSLPLDQGDSAPHNSPSNPLIGQGSLDVTTQGVWLSSGPPASVPPVEQTAGRSFRATTPSCSSVPSYDSSDEQSEGGTSHPSLSEYKGGDWNRALGGCTMYIQSEEGTSHPSLSEY